jgi:protein-S-isoprenylcysteine O-methyltransferase Ste14
MLFFVPLASDSFFGLLAFPPILLAIAMRLIEEEKFLSKKLQGYSECCQKVRYRLIPFIL